MKKNTLTKIFVTSKLGINTKYHEHNANKKKYLHLTHVRNSGEGLGCA